MINSVSNYDGDVSYKVSHGNGGLNSIALKKTTNTDKKQDNGKKQVTSQAETDKFGLRLAKVGLLTGLIVFIALRGVPRKLRSKADQAHKNFIDKEIEVGEGARAGFKSKVQRKVNHLAKAIFNLAPLKDVVVGKALKLTKFTDKIGEKISDVFEKISVRTLNKSYANTHRKIERLIADFTDANKKLPKNEVDIINQKIANIRKVYSEGFSETARRQRLNAVKREFDGYDEKGNKIGDSLMEKVWKGTYKNFKDFIEKSTYNTFVSEEKATEAKLRNATKINNHKFAISNSLNNLCEDSFKLLIHLDTFIEHDDKAARDIIKKIVPPLKQYRNSVKNHGDGQDSLLDGVIDDNLKKLDKVFEKSNKYDKKTLDEVSEAIKSLRARLDQKKRGEINEIMKIYEKYLTINEYKKLNKSAYDATNSLVRSTDLEIDKLFDKIRDLKIGSAPKDTLVVLSSFGVVGYGLSKADNTEEKIAVSIKYGIPTVGAVAIMVYCTVGLISAGPSLLIGLLSGLALNQIGTGVDNFRKQIKNKTSKAV